MHHTTGESIQSIMMDQTPFNESSDANNNSNKKDEKYSLRQRQSRRTNSSSVVTAKSDKRASKDKPKPKAAPLSKYRRKTANARERTRMREINSAFENLRQAVPISVAGPSAIATNVTPNEKLTKITTLRLAMKYITILSDILNNSDSSLMFSDDMDALNNNSELANEIMSKGMMTSVKPVSKQHIVNTSKANSKPNNNNKTTKTIQSRRHGSNKLNLKLNSKSNLGPCLISPMNEISTAADLGLILESDGESLQLSEPCLSPMDHHMKTAFNCSSTSNDSLELGLLLESDGESLHLSEPCLSPLSSLDSLNPFSDLLHAGFNEQTALELYL